MSVSRTNSTQLTEGDGNGVCGTFCSNEIEEELHMKGQRICCMGNGIFILSFCPLAACMGVETTTDWHSGIRFCATVHYSAVGGFVRATKARARCGGLCVHGEVIILCAAFSSASLLFVAWRKNEMVSPLKKRSRSPAKRQAGISLPGYLVLWVRPITSCRKRLFGRFVFRELLAILAIGALPV